MSRLASPLLLALASLAAGAAHADGAAPALQRLTPYDGHVRAAGYDLDLGDADRPGRAATAWSGPVKVSRGAKSCTVSDDVAVVTQPIASAAGRFAYLSTYSGSYGRVYAVDLQDCAVRWTSPSYVGHARFEPTGLTLPGGRKLKLSALGLPAGR